MRAPLFPRNRKIKINPHISPSPVRRNMGSPGSVGENVGGRRALLIPVGRITTGSARDHPLGPISAPFGEIARCMGLNAKTAPEGGAIGKSGRSGSAHRLEGFTGDPVDPNRGAIDPHPGAAVACGVQPSTLGPAIQNARIVPRAGQ